MQNYRKKLKQAKRVLIKIGSSSLSSSRGLNYRMIERLSDDISSLKDKGHEFALVSSGAVASGRAITGNFESGTSLIHKQALAAIGQGHLIHAYNDAFVRYGHIAAQILLTREDIDDRQRYLNIRNTFTALFELGAIPIINENDTVSVSELKLRFSDNDMLSALILPLVEAQVLIILTDTEGVCSADPRIDPNASRICEMRDLKLKDVQEMSGASTGGVGRGGMQSKLMAAYHASLLGVPAVIAPAALQHCIPAILEGQDVGTIVIPKQERMSKKAHWLSFASRPKGRVICDDGAIEVLLEKGRSLLPVGVQAVEGTFREGDTIEITEASGKVIAAGLTNFTSEEILRIKGAKSRELSELLGRECAEEIVHRNNMILKDS